MNSINFSFSFYESYWITFSAANVKDEEDRSGNLFYRKISNIFCNSFFHDDWEIFKSAQIKLNICNEEDFRWILKYLACLQHVDIFIVLIIFKILWNSDKIAARENQDKHEQAGVIEEKIGKMHESLWIVFDNYYRQFFLFLKDFSLIKIFGLRKLYMIAHLWVKNNRKIERSFFAIFHDHQFDSLKFKHLFDDKIKVICLSSHQKTNRLWKIKSSMLSFQP